MLLGLIFFFGSCMGSFIQVIMDRFLTEESWVIGRSHCMHCHRPLNGLMMIPIFSWIFLKGKCYFCQSKIPVHYVLIELFFGSLALFCFLAEKGIGMIKFFMICDLFLIAYFDFKTMVIESGWLFLLLSLVAAQLIIDSSLRGILAGAISVSGIMILFNLWVPDSFGRGDIQLMMICGALLGKEKIMEAWILANLFAGIQAVILLLMKKAGRKSHIPYAPALCLGIAFVLLKNMISFPFML